MDLIPIQWKIGIGAAIALVIIGLGWGLDHMTNAYYAQKDKTVQADVGTHSANAGAEANAGAATAANATTEKVIHTYEETDRIVHQVQSAPDLAGAVRSWSDGIDELRNDAAPPPPATPSSGGRDGEKALPPT